MARGPLPPKTDVEVFENLIDAQLEEWEKGSRREDPRICFRLIITHPDEQIQDAIVKIYKAKGWRELEWVKHPAQYPWCSTLNLFR